MIIDALTTSPSSDFDETGSDGSVHIHDHLRQVA